MIVDRLKGHPEEIRILTGGFTATQLKHRMTAEKWSLHELVMHLCETQDVHIGRLSRMLTEDKPQLASYAADNVRSNGLYLTMKYEKRFAEFEVQRETMTSLPETLTDEQWALERIHPEIEHYSIRKSMEELMRHEERHLYQMNELAIRMRKQG